MITDTSKIIFKSFVLPKDEPTNNHNTVVEGASGEKYPVLVIDQREEKSKPANGYIVAILLDGDVFPTSININFHNPRATTVPKSGKSSKKAATTKPTKKKTAKKTAKKVSKNTKEKIAKHKAIRKVRKQKKTK
jgi:hypothetical protein